MLKQVADLVVYVLILDPVIIIENERGLSRRLIHLIDQGDQDALLDFAF